MKVAVIAGEASGDLLGADLLAALRRHYPALQAEGVAGPALREQGVQALADMRELSVMGLSEVLGELPRLLRLRKRLLSHWQHSRPDLFIGIDAPDFNLGVARRLKAAGVPCVHYVSPTVWAWRPGRVHKIASAVDLLLCLFPFEPDCYRPTPLRAEFVGHPFADQIKNLPDRAALRARLGLADDARVVALVPGSRGGEIRRVAPSILQAAWRLRERCPDLRFLLPVAHPDLREVLLEQLAAADVTSFVRLLDGQMREAVRAADVAVVTSGTATLETMLLGTPFVVAYRASPFTAWLLRSVGLLKIDTVALPNILAGRMVAPELLQDAAAAENLSGALYQLLRFPHVAQAQTHAFAPLARQLDQDSGELGARAVRRLLAARGAG